MADRHERPVLLGPRKDQTVGLATPKPFDTVSNNRCFCWNERAARPVLSSDGTREAEAMGDPRPYLNGIDFCHVMAAIITMLGLVLIGAAALAPRTFG